jgi:DNA-binding response OmpR family regulator
MRLVMATAAAAPFRFVLSASIRVLVVDDDPILREFACVYLASPNGSVETAADAESGLALLAKKHFDIALVDIDMPGMNGIEMVRLMRASTEFTELPIVMVTGLDDIVSIDAAYAAGATSFVTKPVNWRLLSYHLRFILRSHQTGNWARPHVALASSARV